MDWVPLLVCGLTALLGFFAWLVKKIMQMGEKLSELNAQHQNNGGSTTRDAIDRIERKLDLHLNWHMDRTDNRS